MIMSERALRRARTWGLLLAGGLTTAVGCAAASEQSDVHPTSSDVDPDQPEGDVAGTSGSGPEDKALRRAFCCARKKGDRVKSCSNIYAVKIAAANQCDAPLTDNVLRDGECSQYKTCIGKTIDPIPCASGLNCPPAEETPPEADW